MTKMKKYRVAVNYYAVAVEVEAKNEEEAMELAKIEADNDDWLIPDIEDAEIIEEVKKK